ncbi:hypothetical protein K0U07_04565, partial [bacterium]|nr:hypothetical protein [bacterium]
KDQTNHHVIAVIAIAVVTLVVIARIYDRVSSRNALFALGGVVLLSAIASTTTEARTGTVCSRYLSLSRWTQEQTAIAGDKWSKFMESLAARGPSSWRATEVPEAAVLPEEDAVVTADDDPEVSGDDAPTAPKATPAEVMKAVVGAGE